MKTKTILKIIIASFLAAIAGSFTRYVIDGNATIDVPSVFLTTYGSPTPTPNIYERYMDELMLYSTSTPVPLEENEQRYYDMSDYDINYDFDDEVTQPQANVIEAGFIYPDFQNYVIQDDGIVSVKAQDFIFDNRLPNDNYQIHDYYFVYTGPASIVSNLDADVPNKLIPYDETNEAYYRVDLAAHYLQLEGGITNINVINDALANISLFGTMSMQSTLYPSYEQLNDKCNYGKCWDAYAHSDAYVIYNDDEIISIAVYLQKNTNSKSYCSRFIKSININLKTGEILDLDYFLTPDMALVDTFKRECENQNPGYYNYLTNKLNDEELLSYFLGETICPPFVFVYDDHLEIGINYEYEFHSPIEMTANDEFVKIDFYYDDYPQFNPFNK